VVEVEGDLIHLVIPGIGMRPVLHDRIERGTNKGESEDSSLLQLFTPPKESNNINTGTVPLKLYTLYAPPNHRDGVVHHTRAEAEADNEHFDGKTTD
jgi:hypothetical protein